MSNTFEYRELMSYLKWQQAKIACDMNELFFPKEKKTRKKNSKKS
jgi:hypothetical protein